MSDEAIDNNIMSKSILRSKNVKQNVNTQLSSSFKRQIEEEVLKVHLSRPSVKIKNVLESARIPIKGAVTVSGISLASDRVSSFLGREKIKGMTPEIKIQSVFKPKTQIIPKFGISQIPKTEMRIIPKSSSNVIQRVGVIPKSRIDTILRTDYVPRLDTPRIKTPREVPPDIPPYVPGIGIPALSYVVGGKGKGESKLSRKTRRQASVLGVIQKVRGSKSDVYTGLEIRGII